MKGGVIVEGAIKRSRSFIATRYGWIILLIGILFGVFFWRCYAIRHVNLEYVGTVSIEPSLKEIIIKGYPNNPELLVKWPGEVLQHQPDVLGKDELAADNMWKRFLYGKGDRKEFSITIHWEDVIFENEGNYIGCLGCEIDSIRYDYLDQPESDFSIVVDPEIILKNKSISKNGIAVYKIDKMLLP
ncbi:MAG: hypothetical protein OEV59_05395 [Deltaproteobacteria bacterium]|nr:hypothetical protein [Deltaproteobacteria bacterium]